MAVASLGKICTRADIVLWALGSSPMVGTQPSQLIGTRSIRPALSMLPRVPCHHCSPCNGLGTSLQALSRVLPVRCQVSQPTSKLYAKMKVPSG